MTDNRRPRHNDGLPIETIVADAESSVCGGTTRGKPGKCRRSAGWGTDHVGRGYCKLHMGSTPAHSQHAAKIGAVQALTALGQPVTRDPIQALLDLLYEALGNVAFLRQEAAKLGVELIGFKYGAAAGVGTYVQSEEARGIVALYGEWWDRAAKVAKMAVDAGIAKKQVEIAQQQADTLAAIVRHVLDGLDLSEEQRTLGRKLAAEQMRTIAIGPGVEVSRS